MSACTLSFYGYESLLAVSRCLSLSSSVSPAVAVALAQLIIVPTTYETFNSFNPTILLSTSLTNWCLAPMHPYLYGSFGAVTIHFILP
jgi:hypothetical protein